MRHPGATILVTGLANADHLDDLRTVADRAGTTLLIASSPGAAQHNAPGPTCLDLTAYLDWEPCAEACRRWAGRGDLALFREPLLRLDALAAVVRDLGLRCIALDADISYDTDPSWVAARIEETRGRVDLAYYAIDLFADVADAWRCLQQETRPDELTPADLRDICARFPVLLSADVTAANIADIAAFPGAAGVLLTCDERRPMYPIHRHALPFDDLRDVVHALLYG